METTSQVKVKQELLCSFDGCDKAFFKASKLSRHELTHTGERPFACTHEGCDKKFTRDCHLKRHLQTVHSTDKERTFKCTKEGCDAAFFSKQHLNRHEKLHEKAKPFECEFPNCSQSFSKHNQLLIHICKEHTHQQPYKCNQLINGEECEKRFLFPSELKKHIKSAHNYSKYLCGYENCGESFTHSKDLQQHIHQKHENERKIICNICHKLYKTNRSLSQHQLNAHTDKFIEFTCDRGDPPCGKSFKYEKNLQAHIRTAHDKLKPFSCDICDRKFDFNYLLTRHRIKNHTDNINNNIINHNLDNNINNIINNNNDNINNNEINNEIIINIQNQSSSSTDSASDCETTSMTITPTSQLINVSNATPILPMPPVITGVKRLLDRPLPKSKRHKKFPLASFVGLPKESNEQ